MHTQGGTPRRTAGLALLAALALGAAVAAPASAAINGTENANQLAGAIEGSPAGATLDVAPIDPSSDVHPDAVANTPLGGFPTAGADFTILTSGNALLADQPNASEGDGEALGYNNPARGGANDPTTLGVPVSVPAEANCLSFDYKFLSEEFPEFVNAGFNDAFIAELDVSDWSVTEQVINAPNDFAAPKGDKVSVDSVGPTAVSPDFAAGTTYDAATGLLTTKTAVTPGEHTLFLSIFDSGDYIYDSAVFVDNVRFSNEPPLQCKPPDLFGGLVGVAVGSKASVKGKFAFLPITCGLETGITVNCEGKVSLVGKLPSGRAVHAAKAKRLGKGSYSVPPASTGKAKIKLTKKARKAIASKGKLKAKAKVTNTSNGANATFKVTLKSKR